jgi:cysteinyl-tRNA synthetase
MKSSLMVLCALLLVSCNGDDSISPENGPGRNFKQDMRDYVMGISRTAKLINPKFAIIPQNGIELVTINGEDDGRPVTEYLATIDGNGQEDLFYGYEKDDNATSSENSAYLRLFPSVSKNAGKTIFVTDYTSTASKIKSAAAGYVSFAAPDRSLNVIPITAPNNVNEANIATLSQAKNFLYLINPQEYGTKAVFIQAVTATNYDAVIMDLF